MLNDLNDKQKEAVLEEVNIPLLVLAGAGSGKTKALTYKIAYLIKEKNIHPSEIFAVTFTNKAAFEIRERVTSLLGGHLYFPYLGTFHSVFLNILRHEGERINLSNNLVIFDDDDQEKIMKEVFKELNIDSAKFSVRAILSGISKAKSNYIFPSEYIAGDFYEEIVKATYPIYQKKLKENSALDFDDILFNSLYLLKNDIDFKNKFKNSLKYILVDEYQDTNNIQYNLIKEISTDNVCFVGDPDQNIYSWRGTNIQNILSFEKDFPNGKIIKLEQNYRSTKRILAASQSVIAQNRLRYEKKLWTENQVGHPVKLYQALDEIDEARYVVDKIRMLQTTFSDYAVLYRTNAQSRVIEEYFVRDQIPYRIFGGLKFYQRKEIKDIVSYLRFIVNPNDTVALTRIINVPTRKIGTTTLARLQEQASLEGISIGEYILHMKDTLTPPVLSFVGIIEDLKKHLNLTNSDSEDSNVTPSEFIKYVVKKIDYEKYVLPEGDVGISRMENIYEFIGMALKYETITDLLFDISLVQKEEIEESSNVVTMMSIHQAKGLEFKNVFIIGMEENIFPHQRSFIDLEQMEEERRLCYVAMTRAKERLFLSFAQRRMLYGRYQDNPPSRFLSDIDPDHIDYDY
jgi:DNA helicase-2/ATP-dependent DNA helicase PcrA